MGFKFVEVFPPLPIQVYTYVFEDLVYRVVLDVDPNTDPHRILVEVWTNHKDNQTTDDGWHGIRLPYRGFQKDKGKVYGDRCIMAAKGQFGFTFRAKMVTDEAWTWYDDQIKTFAGSMGTVEKERSPAKFSPELRGPDFNRVVGILSVGNQVAAARAQELGFTHVLCVAEELERPFSNSSEVAFESIGMPPGAEVRADARRIHEAVLWIQMNWKEHNQILVYSKYGFQRAGVVALALVLAQNRSMPFEEALRQTRSKRMVFPNIQLKDTIYKLYPRSE